MKHQAEPSSPELAPPAPEQDIEMPSEHELDMHHDTLLKAEGIKANAPLMKHLKPHMAKKMGQMKAVMGEAPAAPKPITSIDGLKAKAKTL